MCGKHIRDVIFCNALDNHGLFRFSFTFIFHLSAFGYSEKESLAQISAACTRNPSKVAAEVTKQTKHKAVLLDGEIQSMKDGRSYRLAQPG